MLQDRVSNPGPLTYESGALPIALRGTAHGHYSLYWTLILTYKQLPDDSVQLSRLKSTDQLTKVKNKFYLFVCLLLIRIYMVKGWGSEGFLRY